MSPIAWITLMVVGIIAIFAIFQFNLFADLVTASGYSLTEVEAGLMSLWIIVSIMLGIFTVRT